MRFESDDINLRPFIFYKLNEIGLENSSAVDESKVVREFFSSILKENKLCAKVKKLQYSDEIEDVFWSISHTNGANCCGLVKNNDIPGVQSIGVDIEKADRLIPKILYDKFIHPEDYLFSPIVTWVVKEAIFKAVSKISNSSFDLIDIVLGSNSFRLDQYPDIFGRFDYWYEETFLISGAIVIK